MEKIKKFLLRTGPYIQRHPELIIVITFFGFSVLLSGLEYTRALVYLSKVDSYKNSARVIYLKDEINKLNRVAGQSNADPAYCSLSLEGLIKNINVAYDNGSADVNDSSLLIQSIHRRVQTINPSPSFNSLLQFLPRVSEARSASEEVHEVVENIKSLTSEDDRSMYCSALVNVLSEVYFVNDIRTAQGVNAMRVGQLENFQVNVANARESLLSLTPPQVFADEHIALNDVLNQLALDLRQDENQYVPFSRRIDHQALIIEEILEKLQQQAADLALKPGRMKLYSSAL